MTPAKALGIGMMLFPIQIKNLAIFMACINLIATASFSPQGSIVALVLVLQIFYASSRAYRPLHGCAATSLEHARVLVGMDGEEQPHDHGCAVLRVRSVLPRERLLGTVRPWVVVGDLRRARTPNSRSRRALPRSLRWSPSASHCYPAYEAKR